MKQAIKNLVREGAFAFCIIAIGFSIAHFAHGETIPLPSPVKATDVPSLINSIIKGILGVVGALSLLMFVYGGMLWLTSMGNSERINKGKETLTWATIGLVVIFSSYAILNTIINALTK